MILLTLAGCLFVSDTELAEWLDADGDGLTAAARGGDDCDDQDATVGAAGARYRDADADGFGDAAEASVGCPEAGWVVDATDCDDTDATVTGPTPRYQDADGDGFGDPAVSELACGVAPGWADNADDCDDSDAARHGPDTWYPDADEDGFGQWDAPVEACARPDGHVPNGDDCDDTNGAEHVIAVSFHDTDGDGYGDPNAYTVACRYLDGPYTTDSTDCDDTDASVNPGAFEVPNSPVDHDCDGVIGDARIDDVGTMVFAEYPGARTGPAVSVGDLVGGRESDIVVGSPLREGGGSVGLVEGRAIVAPHGSLDAIDLAAARSWWVGGDGEEAGSALAAGDFSGDREIDLVVASPGAIDGAGTLHVFQAGFPAGALVPDLVLSGEADGDRAGAVLLAADVNQDGADDLVVGAPGAGKVYVVAGPFAGSADLSVAVVDGGMRLIGPPGGEPGVGSALAVGDLDGDGRDDVVVGAPGYDGGVTDAGGVWVCNGGPLGDYELEGDCWGVTGETRGDAFGSAATLVDLNNDGALDLVVGAPGADGDFADVGAVYAFFSTAGVFTRPTDIDAAELVLYGEEGDEGGGGAGAALAAPGDVNGNGLGDLVVGAPTWNDPTQGRLVGAVYFFLPPLAPGTRDLSTADDRYVCMFGADPGPGCATGETLAPAGDFDDDGLADTLVGVPGYPYDGSVAVGATAVLYGSTIR